MQILYDQYIAKSKYACELAEMVGTPCTMSWRKVVYRWLDWKKKEGKWIAGPTKAYPRSLRVRQCMEQWVKERE